MPRKTRWTALALALTLLAGLTVQAAAAAPLGPRPAIADSNPAGLLGALWGWLTHQWWSLGENLANQARPGGGAWTKGAGGSDPNDGSKPTGQCIGPTQP
jgi:hypothetical protein